MSRGGRRARGLTPRGRALVVVALALGVAGFAVGQQSLLRVAVLLLVLPLAALAVAAASGARTTVRRSTTPARAVVGQTCRVRLDLRNPGRLGTPVLLAQDRLPAGWTRAPRFSVDPLPPQGRAAVAYTATPPHRGRHRLGPLQVLVTDPLGLCELPVRSGERDEVLVLPATEPVPGAGALLGEPGGGDDGGAGSAGGVQGMGTREYRPGDDVRRVHWRSTARRGELMVRQDELPRQRRGVVVLDRRPEAFHTPERFEVAVAAAASLAASLHDAGAAVRLELGDGRLPGTPPGREGLLEELALVQPAGAGSAGAAEEADDDGRLPDGGPRTQDDRVLALALGAATAGPAVGAGEPGGGRGVLAAVLGGLSVADAAVVAGAAPSGPGRRRAGTLAVLVEPPAPGAVELLLRGGWSVLDLSEGEPLADAWLRAGRAPGRTAGAR